MFMKKRLQIILSIIIVIILILFVIYKVNCVNKTEEKIISMTQELLESVTAEDYDKIKTYLRHTDGTELSDEEISNFVLNTELYRAILVKDRAFSYDANTSFWNTSKGQILFSFTALDGENIRNELTYTKDGVYEYLTTDKTQEAIKEMEKYPIALDLANGNNIEYDEPSEDQDNRKIKIYSFVQEENGGISLQVIKEAKEDLKKYLENQMYEGINTLKNLNENYTMEWDKEYKEVSIYYEDSAKDKLGIIELQLRIHLCSMIKQTLDGNSDWRLTIQYYDCNTKELLSAEVVR